MNVVKLSEVIKKPDIRAEIIPVMRKGDIFVYPTDTIYGIGCNAEIAASVKKISDAKGRKEGKSFSVIAPGKEWIWANSIISEANKKFIDTIFPGPYTVVVKAGRNAPKSAISEEKTIGVRFPKHPFVDIISEAGVPFVTTSVNISGNEPAARIEDIPPDIEKIVDWVIDAGKITGHSSRIFDLTTDEIKILRY